MRDRLLVVPPEPRLTVAEYQAMPGLNWSRLKWIGKSPAHYLHALTAKTDDTPALKRGRAVHVAVWEPETFGSRYAVWNGGRRQGKEWERFESDALAAGKETLAVGEYEVMKAIALAVRGSAIAAPYVLGAKAEQSITWTYERPDVGAVPGYSMSCKGRIDAVNRLAISDLKTARDASPSAFAREVLRLEHHVQAAWYRDGYKAATGKELPWSWVVVEATPPHVVQVYRADEETLALGRERYMQLLDLLHACTRDNSWPGYASSEMTLELPRWARPLEDGESVDPDLVFTED